ncbi:hypothetical protein [Burkholderia pseudomallei]|uniref:hypothetical protein n=1 Tax=Burkholderia pseudomallei TaxID=28450 RepID=UPI0022EAABA1
MAAEAEDEARDEAGDEAATADEATRVGVAAGGSVVEAGAPAALAAAVAADATVAVSAAAAAGAGRPVAAQTNSRAATKPGTRKPARAEEASAVIIVALVWSD